jgi:hypothetical protein
MHRNIRYGRLTAPVAICSIAVALIGAGSCSRPRSLPDAARPGATAASAVPPRTRPGSRWPRTKPAPWLPLPCDKLAPAPLCAPPVPTSTARCRDWTVSKLRDVRGPQLVVSAVCAVRGGERLELRRHDPQGFNPADLLLELVVQRSPFPDGPASAKCASVTSSRTPATRP